MSSKAPRPDNLLRRRASSQTTPTLASIDGYHRVRSRTWAGVLTTLAVLAATGAWLGIEHLGDDVTAASAPVSEPEGTAEAPAQRLSTMPDLIGLHETDALKELDRREITSSIQYEDRSGATSTVVTQVPAPGAAIPPETTATLTIDKESAPPEPPSGADLEQALHQLAQLLDAHTSVFAGSYLLEDRSAFVAVIQNDRAEEDPWRQRLQEAAQGLIAVRVDRCPDSERTLREVVEEVQTGSWRDPENRQRSFVTQVDLRECRVDIWTPEVTAAERDRLVNRHGPQLHVIDEAFPSSPATPS